MHMIIMKSIWIVLLYDSFIPITRWKDEMGPLLIGLEKGAELSCEPIFIGSLKGPGLHLTSFINRLTRIKPSFTLEPNWY